MQLPLWPKLPIIFSYIHTDKLKLKIKVYKLLIMRNV